SVDALRDLDLDQATPGALEVVRELLETLVIDLVEDADLPDLAQRVVAVAQQRENVALDEVVADLAAEEGVLDQAVEAQVEVALREVEVDLGQERRRRGADRRRAVTARIR